MTETPRQYKKRIDTEWQKRRKNRDKLIKQIEKYELVDEDYKARIKQEILLNFEKNEKAEKSSELYVKIGEELVSSDTKYQELEQLKDRLKMKEEEREKIELGLRAQKMDGMDETTLLIQMNQMKKSKQELERLEKEIEEMTKEIADREKELEEIEEIYGKKEDIVDDVVDEKQEDEEIQAEEVGNPSTLQEYKINVLRERGKIDHIKLEIIKLLDEGTGIDESMKERIKGEISDVFDEYESKQEGTLRMKSARYLQDREYILWNVGVDKDLKFVTIGGKPAFKVKKSGKYCIMRGGEKGREWFDDVVDFGEIGGKSIFKVKKDGKRCVMRGSEQCGEWFDKVFDPVEIGGKPAFCVGKHGKQCIMRGNKQCGEWFDGVGVPIDVGGKPAFRVNEDRKCFVMRGGEQYSEWFDGAFDPVEIGGKPAIRVVKDGKLCILRGREQCGEWFYRVGNPVEIGGKPVFRVGKDGKRCVMRGREQCGEWFDGVGDRVDIGGKPAFKVKKDGKECVMRGGEQYSEWFDGVGDPVEIGGKPEFWVEKDGNYIQRGESNYDGENQKMEDFVVESETMRDKREKIILQRYHKKQNRDEVIKLIMGSDGIEPKMKKQLESEILKDFSAQFEKVISDDTYQEMDKEYRLLKKIGREYHKKSLEVEKKKNESKQEIVEIDGKLYEIGKSAMKLEDGFRWKKWKLRKTIDEWDELETRQKKILADIYKLTGEERELESSLSSQSKKYGELRKGDSIKQRYRPIMRPYKFDRHIGVDETQLESEKTLKGYKQAYIKIVQEKENKLEALLQQIENLDMGVSDEVKNKIIEQLRGALTKGIEKMKKGDELVEMANEIEEYLDKNLEAIKAKLEQLDKMIQEKREEIHKLQEKETGVSMDELMRIRKEEFNKNMELIRLQEEYQRIKSDLDEKLIKYQGEE